jgi:hypothetical protein
LLPPLSARISNSEGRLDDPQISEDTLGKGKSGEAWSTETPAHEINGPRWAKVRAAKA